MTYTRESYERHRASLGSWGELLPPWEMLEQQEATPLEQEALDKAAQWSIKCGRAMAGMDEARHIARTLLQHTDLTPTAVRYLFGDEVAKWLLEKEEESEK